MSQRAIPAQTRELQARASNPDFSAWVSANAGSGKTHVLATRVVRLLLQRVPPSRILCLTFTKAAAANMSMRVFSILSKWTILDDSKLREQILATGETNIEDEQLVFARRLFARTVETPGGLKIQTIHAFCEKLLHLFPFEANVPARFEVIEDLRRTELLEEVRRETLARAIFDEQALGRALRLVASETSSSSFKELIDDALENQDLLHAARQLEAREGEGAYLDLLAGALGIEKGETTDTIEQEMVTGGLLCQNCEDLLSILNTGKPTDIKLAQNIGAALRAETIKKKLSVYEPLFITKRDQTKRKTLITKSIFGPYPQILVQLEAEQDRIFALCEKRKAAHVVMRTGALIALVGEILAAYRRAKNARGLLDFGDLIEATSRLLKRTDAAWVLHKLDRGIDHILVDEAQDTSPEQWDILTAIAEEFTAGEGARNRERTFFAVGDEKQSIFSFQGAAPRQFNEMRQIFERRSAQAGKPFEFIELKRSFRSAPGILETVDTIFKIEAHYRGLEADQKATVHEAWKEDLPSVIELWPLVQVSAADEPKDWRMPLDARAPNDPPMVVARRIATEISAWLAPDASESVEDHDSGGRRRIRPSDIMILVRSRGPFFDSIIRALKEARVPVAGADRLKLTQHIAVMDLMAAGRAALLPDDDLMLATILKSPFLGLTDEDLIALAPKRTGSLFEALGASDNPLYRKAYARIETWRDNARQLTPFFFYSQILSAERGRHAMLARLGPEAGDAMDEFLRLALDHETREPPSLVNFLGTLETIDLEVKRDMEAGANAVRVMTVHASKGLEAKIVFLADTCGLPTGRHDPKIYAIGAGQFGPVLAWSPGKKDEPKALGRARENVRLQAEEEYRRLLYVAMTRAEERLTIAGFLGKTALKDGSWYQMIEAALGSQLKDVPARWDPSEKILRRIAGDVSRLSALGPLPASLPDKSMPDWIGQPAPKEAAPVRPLTPSTALAAADRLEPEPREPTSFAAAAARAGRLVHGLLQHLPDLPASHRAAAAQRFLAQRGAEFDAEMRERLVAQALDTLNAPLLAPLFAEGSRAEVGIGGRVNLPDGRQIDISAQIDRLAIGESEVLIADFKTGRPRLPVETPPAYLAQLALYRAALAPLYQGKQVRCFLVWTEGPVGHEIPAAMLDAALLDVQQARF